VEFNKKRVWTATTHEKRRKIEGRLRKLREIAEISWEISVYFRRSATAVSASPFCLIT
jgi:hypothetical protein